MSRKVWDDSWKDDATRKIRTVEVHLRLQIVKVLRILEIEYSRKIACSGPVSTPPCIGDLKMATVSLLKTKGTGDYNEF